MKIEPHAMLTHGFSRDRRADLPAKALTVVSQSYLRFSRPVRYHRPTDRFATQKDNGIPAL